LLWGLDYIPASLFSDGRFGFFFNASGIGDGWEGRVTYAVMYVIWRPPESECKAGNETLMERWDSSWGYLQSGGNNSIGFYGFEFDSSVSSINRLEWWVSTGWADKKRGKEWTYPNLTATYGLGLLNEVSVVLALFLFLFSLWFL